MSSPSDLYRERPLSAGYPDMEKLYHDHYVGHLSLKPRDTSAETRNIIKLLGRAIDLVEPREICVVGCGPRPETISALADMGHRVSGVEPVTSYVRSANQFLGTSAQVMEGVAEQLPFDNETFDVLFFETVFEHVDSPSRCLNEIYRVLKPGGILYLTTTNRYRFRLTGKNGEFRVPFFNWFPPIVRECYVHQHLHFNPTLANYSVRPAVHWFCFSDLCRLGRDAQFATFYSLFDLMRPEDTPSGGFRSRLRRILVSTIQSSPWARAIALLQRGNAIVMLKRRSC